VRVSGSIVNLSAIGIVASALADVTHEVLGHLVAAWWVGDRIISISTVALQSAAESRFVAGAGTTANLIIGAVSLLIMNALKGDDRKGTGFIIFLWLFAAFNLLNCGYLVVSALLGSGDWAVVTKGLAGTVVWRVALAVLGATLYVRSLHWLARSMGRLVERNKVALSQVRQIVIAGYVAGGAVMTLASVFNPISPDLILVSGVGASFGLFAGMLLIPGTLRSRFPAAGAAGPASTSLSVGWILLAVVVGGSFIALLGPGIRFGAA
jgi:hypothetical protein